MRSTLRCAICRETTALAEIAYVDACPVKEEDAEEAELKVKGSHSTKVEAIVRQLLQIRAKDPEAKCLVFSTVRTFSSFLIQFLDKIALFLNVLVGGCAADC